MDRVNQVVQEVLADELERIDDERLELVTVTGVRVEPGLSHAVVWFSSLSRGDPEGVAVALGEHRIRINVITPGWIMTERQIQKWLTPEGELEIKRNQVLPDKVRPEDVAPLALFLASDDSRAMSAQEYIVDAGWL